jgi:hypothetical protein
MPSGMPRERDAYRKEAVPPKASGLRQTEHVNGYATPAATPEWTGASAPPKYTYRQEYADDNEFPTPDGYRTEYREPRGAAPKQPQQARFTRSPSPMAAREPERERTRAASSRYPNGHDAPRPAPAPRQTSTTYAYKPGVGVEPTARPTTSRENSARMEPERERATYGSSRLDADKQRMHGDKLYGEIDNNRATARSPRQSGNSKFTPPAHPDVSYSREIRPENVRVQSGYGTRRPSTSTNNRPSYTRRGSSHPMVYAQ